MSVETSTRVWKWSQHSGSKLLVMLALADWSDDQGGNIYPSVAKIARKVRMTDRNAEYTIKDLIASGELAITNHGGGRHSNTYKITIPEDGPIINHPVKPASPPKPTSPVKPTSPLGRSPLHPTPETGFTPPPKPTSPNTLVTRQVTVIENKKKTEETFSSRESARRQADLLSTFSGVFKWNDKVSTPNALKTMDILRGLGLTSKAHVCSFHSWVVSQSWIEQIELLRPNNRLVGLAKKWTDDGMPEVVPKPQKKLSRFHPEKKLDWCIYDDIAEHQDGDVWTDEFGRRIERISEREVLLNGEPFANDPLQMLWRG